jgi:hypothetical protein
MPSIALVAPLGIKLSGRSQLRKKKTNDRIGSTRYAKLIPTSMATSMFLISIPIPIPKMVHKAREHTPRMSERQVSA